MLVSTKGRYALRVMLELAERPAGEYAALGTIAADQGISEKYLESIVAVLSKAGLVDALRGKGGGYRLCRAPEEYSVREILEVTEGDLAPVACLKDDAVPCKTADRCRTISMWRELYKTLNNFFDSYTVADLLPGGDNGSWII